MATNFIVLTPILAFCLGSPPAEEPPRTAEIACPVGTWEGGRSKLVFKQDQLEWEVRFPSVIIYIKAEYAIIKDGVVCGVIREASCCLHPGPIEELKKGDTFSFRLRSKDSTLTLTELKGRFLGDNEQKQVIEAVYKKR